MKKSILSVLAGFVFVVLSSTLCDLILQKMGIMKDPFDQNPAWFIAFVVFYRNLFSAIGSYIMARLAPSFPMRHALIGGCIGLVLSVIGAIIMWDVPPRWYALALVVLALPSAWIGGKIRANQLVSKK
jgi:hypothetical protein